MTELLFGGHGFLSETSESTAGNDCMMDENNLIYYW